MARFLAESTIANLGQELLVRRNMPAPETDGGESGYVSDVQSRRRVTRDRVCPGVAQLVSVISGMADSSANLGRSKKRVTMRQGLCKAVLIVNHVRKRVCS